MRRALLIGINYTGSASELNGCHNDIEVKTIPLLERLGVPRENMIVMLDGKGEPDMQPTRDNVLKQIDRVVALCKKGDSLWVHYSGHGSWTKDRNGDEKDGRDETIYLVDEKEITDDELFDHLVSPLPIEFPVFLVFDCCHSGSGCDLPRRYVGSGKTFRENRRRVRAYAVMISGCRDNQTSADAYIDNQYQGALTWSLTTTLTEMLDSKKEFATWNWKELLVVVAHRLRVSKYEQVPQLSVGNERFLRRPLFF